MRISGTEPSSLILSKQTNTESVVDNPLSGRPCHHPASALLIYNKEFVDASLDIANPL